MSRVVDKNDRLAGPCQHCGEPYKPEVGESLCRDCIQAIVDDPEPNGWFSIWLTSILHKKA